jgi:muramoyltetrapeptide carboxypeptidase
MIQSIKPISVGSTIGLITPSSPLFSGRLDDSVSYFEKNGYRVKVGKHNTKSDRFLAGTDEERAEDIMMFFNDSEVDAMVVTGGGAGSVRTLPLLDYDIIKNNPKPIIGFSDTTSLQLGIYSKTGLNSYTGFTCRDVSEKNSLTPFIKDSLKNCLLRKNYVISQGKTVNTGKITAPLIGGNLMCLNYLIGTPFQPDFKEKIFFFEDVWCEPYVIDGMLSQLYLAGIFEQIAGVVIGTFKNCDAKIYPNRDGTTQEVINDWCNKIKTPCIKDFPYGHFDSRCVLPIGQRVTLDATNCKLHVIFDG